MNRSSDNASLVLPSTGPSVAILLTHCLGHSFSCTEYLILTAVNFKQPFSVCFSNFVYSDRFSILGWGGLEAKYLLVPSFRDKTEKRDALAQQQQRLGSAEMILDGKRRPQTTDTLTGTGGRTWEELIIQTLWGASAEPVLNHLCNGATAISHHKGWIRSPKASA